MKYDPVHIANFSMTSDTVGNTWGLQFGAEYGTIDMIKSMSNTTNILDVQVNRLYVPAHLNPIRLLSRFQEQGTQPALTSHQLNSISLG